MVFYQEISLLTSVWPKNSLENFYIYVGRAIYQTLDTKSLADNSQKPELRHMKLDHCLELLTNVQSLFFQCYTLYTVL
jgi:hypothetical protein